jgi:hypothetical protein
VVGKMTETLCDTISRFAYNKFEWYDTFPATIINYLEDNNEIIWKLLRYATPTAADEIPLSKAEKSLLIYNGQEDSSLFKVFMDVGQPDAQTFETSMLRIANWHIKPETRTTAIATISLQVYCHYKINTLHDYRTRADVIIKELIGTLNGVPMPGGLGALYFDGKRELLDRVIVAGQIPYMGKQLFMSMNVG